VNHELRVSMSHGVQHLQEDGEPTPYIEVFLPAVFIDSAALDVFESQIGLAVGRETCIVEPGDVGMVQTGKYPALARHPFRERIPPPKPSRQFQRHRTIDHAVGAGGQPHRSHAALAQFALQEVRADGIAGAVRRPSDVLGAYEFSLDSGDGARKPCSPLRSGTKQEIAETRLQFFVLGSKPLKPRHPIGDGQVQGIIEQAAENGPSGGIDCEDLHGAILCQPRMTGIRVALQIGFIIAPLPRIVRWALGAIPPSREAGAPCLPPACS
jgi:hypothetical protein